MSELLSRLERLVACDTQNPPRAADGVARLFDVVEPWLVRAGFSAERRDLGDGCAWLWARRGSGGPLCNVHVDTVPICAGWTSTPHALVVRGDRAVGLGACDIKGAVAALSLAVEDQASAPVEVLLTSDEEAGSSLCVRSFVAQHGDRVRGRLVVVAEPTSVRGVLGHRGIGTATATFAGVPGHSSLPRAFVDSANHKAVHFAARALALAEDKRNEGLDPRFHLGVIQGGEKPNMIAASCTLRLSVRPPAGVDVYGLLDELESLEPTFADPNSGNRFARGYLAPSLSPSDRARDACKAAGIEVAPPVDFFAEAALFQQAGADALVLGPGDIARAHAADEDVAVDELVRARAAYARLLTLSTSMPTPEGAR